jgi:hypothetical protein
MKKNPANSLPSSLIRGTPTLRRDRDNKKTPVISTNNWIGCQRNKSRTFAN